jgi:hypothetical protein
MAHFSVGLDLQAVARDTTGIAPVSAPRLITSVRDWQLIFPLER